MENQPTLKTFTDEQNFISAGLDLVRKICEEKKGIVRIGLSGGSTPGALYKAIAQESLPFERIELYQVDERYVPKNDPDSNYQLISQTIEEPLRQVLKAFYYFETSLPIAECLQQYEENLKRIPGQQLDLIILGIGPDGHTASLFPGSPVLKEEKELVAHTTTDQFAIHDRLTVTFPFILKSSKLLVLLKGKEKQSILEDFLYAQKSIDQLPAKALLPHSGLSIYFLKI